MFHRDADRDSLRAALGVDLEDGLLERAVTHRSFSYEHGAIPNNERLEFLGDAILGQAVTVMLFTTYPNLPEGELAKRRASLVSTIALADVARSIDLGRYLLLGRGEAASGGRDKASILADTTEAIIGAVYLTHGPDVAAALVLRLLEPLLADPNHFGVSMDPKTTLQELASTRGVPVPVYTVTSTGPDHDKTFHATVQIDGLVNATGDGSSKKYAEMAAALTACAVLTAG